MDDLYCNEIDWIVDFFGTDVILQYFISKYGGKIEIGNKRNPPSNFKNGLYFSGAHWYCVTNINGKITKIDSYENNHQIKGTAHFCQTFALMYYLGLGKLFIENDYEYNIKVAIQFWIDNLQNDKVLRTLLLNELKTEPMYADRIVLDDKKFGEYYRLNKSKKIKNYTWTDLKKFLLWIQNNSHYFINCKQS